LNSYIVRIARIPIAGPSYDERGLPFFDDFSPYDTLPFLVSSGVHKGRSSSLAIWVAEGTTFRYP